MCCGENGPICGSTGVKRFGEPREMKVTHVLSIPLEDLPKYVDELIIVCGDPISLHLERLVGFSYEDGVEDSHERVDGHRVWSIHRVQDITRNDSDGRLGYSAKEENRRGRDGNDHTPRFLRPTMARVHRERAGTWKRVATTERMPVRPWNMVGCGFGKVDG